jgi:hypothetical protein
MEAHWCVFRDRLLEPALEGHSPPPLTEMCQRYGIKDEATVSNMLNTTKKCVRRVLKDYVRQTVVSSEAQEEELKEISKFLEREHKI